MRSPILYSYSFEYSSSPVICKTQNPTEFVFTVQLLNPEVTWRHILFWFFLDIMMRLSLLPWETCDMDLTPFCFFILHLFLHFQCSHLHKNSQVYATLEQISKWTQYSLALLTSSLCSNLFILPSSTSVVWCFFPSIFSPLLPPPFSEYHFFKVLRVSQDTGSNR